MKLSKLQKWILKFAYDHQDQTYHCYILDVLQGYYELQAVGSWRGAKPEHQNFRDLTEDEYKKIRAARSAVSRAFVTLMNKGFVWVFQATNNRWTGIKITDAGKLTVNKAGIFP